MAGRLDHVTVGLVVSGAMLAISGLVRRSAKGWRSVAGAFWATAFLLSACVPTAAPPPEVSPQPGTTTPPPDPEMRRAEDYYRKVQAHNLSQGLLRTDRGGRDTPFDARMLAQNFLAIAFFDEFSDVGGRLVAGGPQQTLHRWQAPVRVSVGFGASVPEARRARTRTEIAAYLARLARLSGLSITLSDDAPNFRVLFLGPAERRGAAPDILGFAPGTSAAALRSVLDMAPDIYCTAFSYSTGSSPIYDRTLAIIRAELPDLMTSACIHEEIAQGLGLVNDSPSARPSIFNDDEEFALLTRQDELMLRLLYDRRLRPGMSLAEAKPIVEIIASELKPGES